MSTLRLLQVLLVGALLAFGCESTRTTTDTATPVATASPIAQPKPKPEPGIPAVKVYGHLSYQIADKGYVWTSTVEVPLGTEGSAFAVQVDGRRFLLTARHVCAGAAVGEIRRLGKYDLTKKNIQIVSVVTSIRVDGLAFEPTSISFSKDQDLALITLPDTAWKALRLEVYPLGGSDPAIGTETDAWGFPGTPTPLLQRGAVVTTVARDYLVLNQPIAPGFSGGPVIDRNGALLGMTLASTKKQGRVQRLTPALLQGLVLDLQPYRDGLPLTLDTPTANH